MPTANVVIFLLSVMPQTPQWVELFDWCAAVREIAFFWWSCFSQIARLYLC